MDTSFSVVSLYDADSNPRSEGNGSSGNSDGCITAGSSPLSSIGDFTKLGSGDSGSFFSDGPALLDIPRELVNDLSQRHSIAKPGIHKTRKGNEQRTVDYVKRQLLELKNRVRRLEEENETLKDYVTSVLLDRERVSNELAALRVNYHEELAVSKANRCRLDRLQDELVGVNKRLAEADRFILDITDLNPENPFLHRDFTSFNSGHSTSLQDSNRATVDNKHFPWLKLLSALEGPRTLSHYLSALNLTVNARKELRDHKKVTQFWKLLAKTDPTHADTVTPSISELENMNSTDLSAAKARVLDDLIGRLKATTEEKRDSEGATASRTLHSTASDTSLAMSVKNLPSSSLARKDDVDPQDDPTMSHSPIGTPGSRSPPSNIPCRSPSNLPTRRRASVIEDNMPSLATIAKRLSDPLSQGSSESNSSLSSSERNRYAPSSVRATRCVSFPPTSKKISRRVHRILDTSIETAGPKPFPCQALRSLERICAAFSGSSLCSLEAMSEEESGLSKTGRRRSQSTGSTGSGSRFEGGVLKPTNSEYEAILQAHLKNQDKTSVSSTMNLISEMTTTPAGNGDSSTNNSTVKCVRWAIPLSPENISKYTRPALSPSSESDRSSSGSGPDNLFIERRRSPSSPTPIRRRAGDTAKASIAHSIHLLKPRPSLPSPSTPRRKNGQNSPPSVPGTISGSPSRSATSVPSPIALPPKSPLRLHANLTNKKTSDSTEAKCSMGPSKVASNIPMAKIPSSANNVKLTSIPPSGSPKSNVKIYDYTKPTMPLKVIKRNSPRKEQLDYESTPAASNPKPPNPTRFGKPHGSQYNTKPDPSSPQDGPHTPPPQALDPQRRLATDLSPAQDDLQVSKPRSTTIVPPIRTSSLRPPKLVQAALRRSQYGRLQPVNINSLSPPSFEMTKPLFVGPTARGALPTPTITSSMVSGKQQDVPQNGKESNSKSIKADKTDNSLAKLRMTVTPPVALVHPMSRPGQRR